MKNRVRTSIAACAAAALLSPLGALAAEQDVQQKLDSLSQEVQALKKQVADTKPKAPGKNLGDWLTLGGDYRFRADSLEGKTADYYNFQDVLGWMMGGLEGPPPAAREGETVKNRSLYTNRFGLNLKAKVTQNVSLTTRLLLYKAFGNGDSDATMGPYFSDRVGVFDGTAGHVPDDGKLTVDQVYVTWNNILSQPVWFSVGRRPSTGGIPSYLRQNSEKPGNGGIPALLVDYAFDGMTLGYAPEIDLLPGAYGKICYGRGFESGFEGHGARDTDMLGVSIVPVDIDPLYLDLQWNRGFHIFDFPVMDDTALGMSTRPGADLGSIDWYALTAVSTLKKVGPGVLSLFGSAALSRTNPTDKTLVLRTAGSDVATGAGLLYSNNDKEATTGWSAYVGARYDFTPTLTKLGFEYNHGSKNWITFTPAADDLWTSKLGTRGNVYEVYLIQELNDKPIASYLSKAFFRLGYQYYDFEYTGSNNWVGEPLKISELSDSMQAAQMLVPVKRAYDVYATFEVRF